MSHCHEAIISIVWHYRIRPRTEEKFRTVYGEVGDWVKLFSKGRGYLGTTLIEIPDEAVPHFLTVDYWAGEDQFKAFQGQFQDEYAQLDEECAALTTSEQFIGVFTGPLLSSGDLTAGAEESA